MSFLLAKKLIKEIDRVTKKYFFVSLISSDSNIILNNHKDNQDFVGEIQVEETHEKGTIQSFFDVSKIEELIKDTSFTIKWAEKHVSTNLLNNTKYGRYYLVLEKI